MTAPGIYTARSGHRTVTFDGATVRVLNSTGREKVRVALSEIVDLEVAPVRGPWPGHLKLVTRRMFPVRPLVYTAEERAAFEALTEAIRYRLRFPQLPAQPG